jgi:hypothetical protein
MKVLLHTKTSTARNLLEEVNFQHTIKALYADRAYDRHKLYKLCKEYDIKTKVLPKNGAAEHPKTDYMSDRNAAIRLIKLYGEDRVCVFPAIKFTLFY